MAHKEVYGVCKNKCLVPVSSKEEVENKVVILNDDDTVTPINLFFRVTGEYQPPSTLGMTVIEE